MLTRLAIRNLWRNPRRSVLTVGGIAFAVGIVIIFQSFQRGAWASMVTTAISASSGHVVVQGQGWEDEQDPKIVVESSSLVVETLQGVYPEASVVRRIQISGLLTSPTGSAPVGMFGFEPEAERALTLLDERLTDGEWVHGDRDILLGEKLASALQVELGDKVVFMAQGGGEEVDSRLFRVSGLYSTGTEQLDSFSAYVRIDAAQEFLRGDDPVSQIAVNQRSLGLGVLDTSAAEDALGRPELSVMPWTESLKLLKEQMDLDRQFGIFLLFFIGAIAVVGIMNAILMGVMERIREFGVMIAVGMRPKDLARLVVLEGVVLGVAGAVVGMALGLMGAWPLTVYGIDYGEMMASASPVAGAPIDTVLRGNMEPTVFLGVASMAIISATLASIWPAWQATRLEPVETMRHT